MAVKAASWAPSPLQPGSNPAYMNRDGEFDPRQVHESVSCPELIEMVVMAGGMDS